MGPHTIPALHALRPAAAVIRENECGVRGRRNSENISRTPPGFLLCEFGPIDRKLEYDENMKDNYRTIGVLGSSR